MLAREGKGRGMMLVLALVVGGASFAPGREFFVKAGAEGGDGTEKRPFGTLAEACAVAGAGDTVRVKAGTYREALVPQRTGLPGRPLVFEAEPGVWVKGSDVVSGFVAEGDGRWVKRPWRGRFFYDAASMEGIGGAPHKSSARSEQVFVNGQPLQWVPERGALGEGSFYWAPDGSELVLELADGVDPNERLTEVPLRPFVVAAWPGVDIPRCRSEAVRRGQAVGSGALPEVDHVEIRGFGFAHCAATINRPGVRVQGRHWVLEKNRVEWMNTVGIGVDDDAILRDNVTWCNGQAGIGGEGSRVLLDGNLSWFDNVRDFSTSWGGAGLKFARTTDFRVRRQTVVMAGGPGIWFDIDCARTVIEDCVVAANRLGPGGGSHGGIFYEISYQAKIHRNTVFGNLWGGGPHGRPGGYTDAYGGGVTLSASSFNTVRANTLIFCDAGLSLLGAARGLGAEPPGAYWRRHGHEAWVGEGNRIAGNVILSDRTKVFGVTGAITLNRSSGNRFFDNEVIGSRSGGMVLAEGQRLFPGDPVYPAGGFGAAELGALQREAAEELRAGLGRLMTALSRSGLQLGFKGPPENLEIVEPDGFSLGLIVREGNRMALVAGIARDATLRLPETGRGLARVWQAEPEGWRERPVRRAQSVEVDARQGILCAVYE